MGRMAISFRVGLKLGWVSRGFWDLLGWILYGLFGEIEIGALWYGRNCIVVYPLMAVWLGQGWDKGIKRVVQR